MTSGPTDTGLRLFVVGLSHRTARVEQREKAALTEPAARALVRALASDPWVEEAAALSTCNRTELYVVAGDCAAAESAARLLSAHTRISSRELACAHYVLRDEEAVRHLFLVAAGLDSMVIGESEIAGQVRSAWRLAAEEAGVGPLLSRLVQAALQAAGRVRRETRVGRGAVSVASVAVGLLRRRFEDLASRSVLVVGAGALARSTALALRAEPVGEIVVANRTASATDDLAALVGGRCIDFTRLGDEFARVDAVISATDAPHPLFRLADVESALRRRVAGPLMLIDLAVPRDIEARVASLPSVILHDIDDLAQVVEANIDGRRREAARAEAIIRSETERFDRWRQELAVAPTMRALRARAESIRRAELARARSGWDGLGQSDLERLEFLTRSIVNRLLHEPTARVRAASREPQARQHVDSLRYLFALDADARAHGAQTAGQPL